MRAITCWWWRKGGEREQWVGGWVGVY